MNRSFSAAAARIGIIARMAFVAFTALVGCTAALSAQGIPKSQLGSVSQNVAGTQIDIVYRRPVARGRALFGSLVPWDRVWSPSADSAPRFTTSRAIEVNGAPLAAGTYSLWAIPGEKEWTWIFNSQAVVFHMRYAASTDVLRVKATPETGSHVETLSFSFPVTDADSAVMHMQWGTTSVPLRIRAKPNS